MVKKQTVKEIIKYYYIKQLAITTIILLFSHNLLFKLICDVAPDDSFYTLYKTTFNTALPLLWIVLILVIIRSRRYNFLTGRNYRKDSSKYKRSYHELVEYFKDADPHKLDTSDFPIQPWSNITGIVFGRDNKKIIAIPTNSECNIAVFGPPGSGKTSGIAIVNAMTFKGSVLAIDIKGDIFNYVSTNSKRKIIRFCPDSPNALNESAHFNPLRGIKSMDITTKKLYIESMATILIPDVGKAEDNYFTSRARKYFQGICHLLMFENKSISFPDIIHAILRGNAFDWVTRAMNSNCTEAAEYLSSFYGNSEKNVAGAYDSLCTAITPFSNPILDELLTDNSHTISISALDKKYDIYLQISQEHLNAYAPIFTLIIQSFSTAFTRRPDSSTGANNRPILMLLDEFPQLTFSYALINQNLSTLRSKSIICMLLQQNLSQLNYKYQTDGAKSIIANCNYQVILGSNDISSSKIFSETFGTKKVLKISTSESSSKENNSSNRSVQEARESIFFPEDFGDLSNDNKLILYFKGKYCKCNKLNCYRD